MNYSGKSLYVIGGINLEKELITLPPITQQSADLGFMEI
jgi:hypothetical protein